MKGLAALVLFALGATVQSLPLLEGKPLKVMTYNVWGLPNVITRDETYSRMSELSPRLNGWDIIGVQEDWTDFGHDKLSADLTYSTNDRQLEKEKFYSVFGAGLTFLTSHEVILKEEHIFDSRYGFDDMWASKGFQLYRVRLEDGVEIDVYNSHLDAGSNEKDDDARRSNAEQLANTMNTVSAGRAVIFLGDTNLGGGIPVDEEILNAWMTTANLKDACIETGCPEPGNIDRVLFRSGAGVDLVPTAAINRKPEFQKADGGDLSDHDPIEGQFMYYKL
eukprot:TRINITY_DN12632_c0_g1::TRINITY_DN12632_c0_g1_i1::g.13559::m.13559 TRINITY_DN12632_c0_g1::TRINITY_DN12632_c0_g1_i1::g.13559  ORF type:complete len:295 (+),score=73.37,sp/P9WKQ1/SMASE_MYCTU/28.73/4e-15,Exo_endo_phos/PF03372.18/4.2e-09,Orn_Arg_deC_N/PF02784.11/0.21 TRINITY_DN12632_c0_g1_i1:52-885(+)